jgi:hypothetical protein
MIPSVLRGNSARRELNLPGSDIWASSQYKPLTKQEWAKAIEIRAEAFLRED